MLVLPPDSGSMHSSVIFDFWYYWDMGCRKASLATNFVYHEKILHRKLVQINRERGDFSCWNIGNLLLSYLSFGFDSIEYYRCNAIAPE
jgi:hypothetical protein